MVPQLETDRLLLRPRTLADLEDYVAMDSDPQVRRYITPPFRADFTPDLYRAKLPARIAADHGEGLGFWTLRLKAREEPFVGTVFLISVEGGRPEGEIGWRLPLASWGRGYVGEAARRILRHGWESVKLAALLALIHRENERSIAVAARLGFKRDGVREAHGATFDRYRLTREIP